MIIRNPKGSSVINVIAAVVVVVLTVATVGGVAGGLALDCYVLHLICSSGGGGGGGGGATTQTATVGASCSSAPNSCGMTNLGTIVQTGGGGGACSYTCPQGGVLNTSANQGGDAPNICEVGDKENYTTYPAVYTCPSGGPATGACNATPPPDSECPTPTIGDNGFYANPSTVGQGGQTTLYWDAANATDCTITGDNGFSYSSGASGSTLTNPITQTTTFTLNCSNGGGPQATASVRVIISPNYQEI